jgi:cysteine desulfurase
MRPIYLDNNASTPVLPEVWEAMRPFAAEHFGNPASSHQFGRRARQALEEARETIARCLDAHADEVVFTSGATEANNLAIHGLAGTTPGSIVVSPIEHPCVLEPVHALHERGLACRLLNVTSQGIVRLPDEWPDDVRLAAVMLANHETGAIQPIAEVSHSLAGRAPLHCDAAAAAGKIALSFRRLGVSSLTLSAHKFHGPKGIGALLLRRGVRLQPLWRGGHQQQGRRPGTEPVFLAVGMAAALERATRELERRAAHVADLRRRFLDALRQLAAPVIVNGPERDGVPHTLNLSLPGCKADALLMALDLAGIACATGSACSSGSLLPSPVLRAMAVPDDVLRSGLRFSFSHLNTPEEIDEAARRIAPIVARARHAAESES